MTEAAIDVYRTALRALDDWEPYLRQHSRLPGLDSAWVATLQEHWLT
jgi:hypothetical protein